MYGQKTAFLVILWQIEMKLLHVEIEIYHLKMHFKVVRHQMSHCYLTSKFKNNTRKWYFEYFIADYFPTINKKDPVQYLTNRQYRHSYLWKHYKNSRLTKTLICQDTFMYQNTPICQDTLSDKKLYSVKILYSVKHSILSRHSILSNTLFCQDTLFYQDNINCQAPNILSRHCNL